MKMLTTTLLLILSVFCIMIYTLVGNDLGFILLVLGLTLLTCLFIGFHIRNIELVKEIEFLNDELDYQDSLIIDLETDYNHLHNQFVFFNKIHFNLLKQAGFETVQLLDFILKTDTDIQDILTEYLYDLEQKGLLDAIASNSDTDSVPGCLQAGTKV